MARTIALLFDGTWNNRKDRTNVTRMRDSIASRGQDDPDQPCFYDEGVGNSWYDRFTGALFARGLSLNISQGYQRLARRFEPGDQIFVFGFSRGAYTARSLVGLIRKCGILKSASDDKVKAAYELYRDKDIAPDHPVATEFRARNSHETRVRFIGVWDTVGAVGVPISHVPFSRDYYQWHDTALSKIVDYAFHAIAVDEHRKDYGAAVWTEIKPENIEVEQKWFIGAHANVGGGYDKRPPDTLPNPPLRWIQDKAEAAGLALRHKVEVGASDHLADVDDSHGDFMYGIYQVYSRRFNRTYGKGVNETVHESVWQRWNARPDYRPQMLGQHPDRPG